MSKKQAVKNIKIDKSFVNDLIMEYGVITAIKHMSKLFTDAMNENIDDLYLRVMIWQLTHSLNKLEELSMTSYSNIVAIQELVKSTKDDYIRTIGNHIILATQNMKSYVKI